MDVTHRRRWTPEDVAAAAQLACVLEASAPKPGNVSPGRDFPDARYEDFVASAVAIGGPIAAAGECALGTTIRRSLDATARWTGSNTNLGIVLLLAPLARAAIARAQRDCPLRDVLRDMLAATSVDDARDVYAAIRQTAPGGLGSSPEQDVRDEPTVTLLDAMRLAADRDGIAREYATGFERTFDAGVPALRRARADGLTWNDAVVETFLTLLSGAPDTHVVRRAGAPLAERATWLAADALSRGGVRSADGRQAIEQMDRELRDDRHLGNPGTTADLTAASIFVVLIDADGAVA
jgi:triphosphoribosyl-dephospho-CoA synthase